MLTKTKLVLAGVLVLGLASAAVAQEAVNQSSNQYPSIARNVQQESAASAYAYAPVRHSVKPFSAAERELFKRATGDAESWNG